MSENNMILMFAKDVLLYFLPYGYIMVSNDYYGLI